MPRLNRCAWTLLAPALLLAAPATAQEHHDVPPRVGLMSPQVLQRRLELMGYANVRIVLDAERSAQITATRGGQTVQFVADRAEWSVSPEGQPLPMLIRPDLKQLAPVLPQAEPGKPGTPVAVPQPIIAKPAEPTQAPPQPIVTKPVEPAPVPAPAPPPPTKP